jgi:hypothetical protein
VQSVGGICTIAGDKLFFHYSGIGGAPSRLEKNISRNGMYANGATGLATLRRDGFVSLNSSEKPGIAVTGKIIFETGKYLFVNVNNPGGILRAELLDENNNPIEPYNIDNCIPVSCDSTKKILEWKGAKDLSGLSGRVLKIGFNLAGGDLYSFWISNNRRGTSNGYLAAGALGHPEFVDR